MRFLGHPVHTMLVHFPVALWPAHWVLHLAAHRLPAGVAAQAGFWLLAAGTGLGWLAGICGASDLVALQEKREEPAWSAALRHGAINGSVLVGFTVLLALETGSGPAGPHGPARLALEGILLLLLGLGNWFGGQVVWGRR